MKKLVLLLTTISLMSFLCALINAELDRVRLSGVIIGVDVEHHVFGLHTERGDIRIAVNERTKIWKNGREARLGDLKQGDLARVAALRGHDHFLAVAVNARTPDHHEVVSAVGKIQELSRDGSFVLVTDRGRLRMLAGDRTRITINGRQATFGDLQNGDTAKVEFTRRVNDHEQHLAVSIAVRRQ